MYDISVTLTDKDVKIIRRDFDNYLDESGGFSIEIVPRNDVDRPTEELQDVIKSLLVKILVALNQKEVH